MRASRLLLALVLLGLGLTAAQAKWYDVLGKFGFFSNTDSPALTNHDMKWWGDPAAPQDPQLKSTLSFSDFENPPTRPLKLGDVLEKIRSETRDVIQKGQQLFEPYRQSAPTKNNVDDPFGFKAYETASRSSSNAGSASTSGSATGSSAPARPAASKSASSPADYTYATTSLPLNQWGFKDAAVMAPVPPKPAATTTAPVLDLDKYRQQSTFGPPTTNTPMPDKPTSSARPAPKNANYQQYAAVAANPIAGIAPRYTAPGGIALNKAAAERLALNISIESLTYRDGHVVVSGTGSGGTRTDAALFLTSLRLACGTQDPFFSLDPVDSAAWSEQGNEAMGLVWDRVKTDYQGAGANGFSIETFSVRRRFPAIWADLEQRFPELRTRLVFRPAELKDTRVGEILYKADVLLKELTSGVSVVQPNLALRAADIPGYISSDQRTIARSFLIPENRKDTSAWRGYRLWFDLLPQANPDASGPAESADGMIDRSKRPDLYATLRARGFIGRSAPSPIKMTNFATSDGVIDVSEVYPKMFVRRHDHASRRDITGTDTDLDLLSGDVNERTAQYVNAYQELRDLTDVFRAYVAGVKLVRQNARICASVRGMPLTEGEKVASPLPEFHPSELFLTVGKFVWSGGGGRGYQISNGTSINGGIAMRGTEFAATAGVERETPVIRQVKQSLAAGIPAPRWSDYAGRQYLAFNLDAREPLARTPITAPSGAK